MAKELDLESSIAILVGAGVKINRKTKTQTYTVGMQISEKVARAGAFLDAIFYKEPNATEMRPEWRTVWVHKEGCACVDCLKKHNKTFHKALKDGDLFTAIKMFNAA
jgi:hypothetical protein